MKSVVVLLVAMLVVAGFAVGGSRAQPVPGAGVAAQQCQSAAGDLCRPLTGSLSLALDEQGDVAGANAGIGGFGDGGFGDTNGDPEWHWRDLVARLVVEAATWFAEHFGRRYVPDSPGVVPDAVFDATR